MPRLAELAWGFVLWRERENGASLHLHWSDTRPNSFPFSSVFPCFSLQVKHKQKGSWWVGKTVTEASVDVTRSCFANG